MTSSRIRVLALLVADAVCFCAVFMSLAWGYRAVGLGHYKYGLEFYLRLWPAVVAYVALNALFRLYHGNPFYPAAPVEPVEELRRLFGSSLITHLGILAVLALAFQTTEHYSRAVIAMSTVFTAFAVQPVRNLVRRILRRCGVGQIAAHVIGDPADVRRMEEMWRNDIHTGFRVAAESEDADLAVVCGRAGSARADEYGLCRRYRHVEFIRSGMDSPFFCARVVSLGEVIALEVSNQRKMTVLRAEKQVLDKVLSVLAFVLALPLFLVIPALIKLTSRGPVFYRQNRLGKCGRPIRVWKFRSMYADADERLKAILAADPAKRAEWEANFKLSDDPRVTPLGRFLRKTSIDELPQLFNVFAGDMALVGPRPIVEKEVACYGDAYETFSSVKPGITGLWQASGRSDTDYARRVALDVQYVLNWSPWMDLWILFRTVSAVLFMRGAR